tara:strand:+ start:42 stop:566 length:525 start_codon:yes stop_codon:yes gene_type:complete
MDCTQTIEKEHGLVGDGTEKLHDTWVLWGHLPHNTDWSLSSYINIATIKTVGEVVSVNESIPEKMIKNCMLFLMREGINPTWEDKKNINGGCFSFKISNKDVPTIWKKLVYLICGESISTSEEFLERVNGITISPKKAFCIVKIWMSDIKCQSTTKITKIENLSMHGCIFKKHK